MNRSVHGIGGMFTLVLISGIVGCGKNPVTESSSPGPIQITEGEGAHGHDHQHGAGPNGGAIADWGGGKYHVEFTVNHGTQQATVFVLGSDAQTPAPIAAGQLLLNLQDPMIQVELLPEPLAGEASGTSSRFVGKHEQLGTVQEFAGTISGEVAGTPYAGDFHEVAH